MEIKPGDRLLVRTAKGQKIARRAVSEIEKGDTFPIVWVCDEKEYEAAQSEGREPNKVPWPANAVEKDEEWATSR